MASSLVGPSTAAACSRAHLCAAARPAPALQQVAAARRHGRRRVQPRLAASKAEPASSEAPEGAGAREGEAPLEARKPKLMTDAWNEVVQLRKEGTIVEATVESANKSGLLLPIGRLRGFLPYKLLDPSRLAGPDGERVPMPARGHTSLIGTRLRVKVSQVIVPENRLIVSEKAVLLEELAEVLRPGDVVEGVVGSALDWGAFVECRTVNGAPCPRAEAVLPVREISYSWINAVTDVLAPGQPVRAVVLYRDKAPEAKVVVSLKRLEQDPLKETLDVVLPLGPGAGGPEPPAGGPGVPQGVDEILEALDAEPAVDGITLGRCVEEKRTVSQDLELWITKETVADGYNLAVRAGRVVQEVLVATRMSPEEMRATVQRVLRSIN